MNIGQWALGQKRLFLILTFMFSFLGLLSLSFIPKDEDPLLPDWFASLVVVLPGAEVQQMDEMIAKPINEKLKEIDELKKIETTTRMSVTSFQLEMKDSYKDTKVVWDKVRRALDEIKRDFPSGTQEPVFFESTNRLETILLALTSDTDLIESKKIALELKQKLLSVPGTSRVILHGDPQEEIQVQFQHERLERLSIPHGQIIQKIKNANTGIPAGSIEMKDQIVPLVLKSRLENAEQVANLKIIRGSGEPIDLKSIAEVKLQPKRFENKAYYNQKPALFIGVVAQKSVEIVDFGSAIRKKIEEFKSEKTSHIISIQEVSFNPDRTKERLNDLLINLIVGILTIGGILFFWMGWKVGLTVSLFVPLISLVGLFVYSLGGGVLHQISLAAFVISLGQFIDNIIVIVEWMDSQIRKGKSALKVAEEAIQQFKKPMFFATGTNISAFLPMLLSTGTTAEFTFSIPVVSIITMITAWIVALFVVPVFAGYLFHFFPARHYENKTESQNSIWLKFGQLVSRRPLFLSGLSLLIVVCSSVGFVFVKKQFFPSADRNQFIVKLELPEGTPAKLTVKYVKQIEDYLVSNPDIISLSTFVGEALPRFYYNVGLDEWGSHVAEMIVLTKDKSVNKKIIQEIHNFAKTNLPHAFVLAKNLEQGPPVPAPLEYKIFDEDSEKLEKASKELKSYVSENYNNIILKDNMGAQVPRITLNINQDLIERFNLSEDQLAMTLLSSTQGLSVSKYIEDSKTKDIRLMGPELTEMDQILNIPIKSSSFRTLRLRDIANPKMEKSHAVIRRLNGNKLAGVFGWPQGNLLPDQIVSQAQEDIQTIAEKHKLLIEVGGEVEGSGEANMAILKAVPIGILVLIICLLLEFNSVRKMIIILLSVPFVIAGVTPGLLIGNAAFGFMSLLGVLALVGIVVNNSILLIESIDENRDPSSPLQLAIVKALESRTRPIILTAITTISGLLPMAFEKSTLWPPLALAMISGLVGSTLITLIFVPSLYMIFFNQNNFKLLKVNFSSQNKLSILVILGFIIPHISESKTYDFQEAIQQVEQLSPDYLAAKAEKEKIQTLKEMQTRSAFFPKVGMQLESLRIHEQRTQTIPFGTFEYGKRNQILGGIEITQPLFNLQEMSGERKKILHLVNSKEQESLSVLQRNKKQMVHLLIEFQKMKLTLESLKRLENSLIGIESEISKFVKIGTRGKSDLLNVQLALSENRSNQVLVTSSIESVKSAIKIYLPDFENLLSKINSPTTDSSNALIRPEIKSINAFLESQKETITSVRQGHLPTIELKGRYTYTDQNLLDQKEWFESAVVFKWILFEGGTRQSAISAQIKELSKIEKSKQALEASLNAEAAEHDAQKNHNLFKLKVTEYDLKMAEQAKDEDKRNSKAGRTPLRDWLSSEIRFEQKKLELETLKLDKIKIQYNELYTKGLELK
jgi:multidrug efflux pump subunit AcrB/outer membrane protein TolC